MRIGKGVGPKSNSEIREKIAKMKKAKEGTLPKGPQVNKKPAFITGEAEKALAQRKANPNSPAAQAQLKSNKPKVIATELKSDVGLNKPNDPGTQEKLKGLLKSGGFNFSDKERDALSSILGMKK